MSALPNTPPNIKGGPLRESDYAALEARGIDRSLAESSLLRRVDSITGADIVGQSRGNYAGIVIPNVLPAELHVRDYRLRRDNPEFEETSGGLKVRQKYMAPPGRGNMAYFTPGTSVELLSDPTLPLVITEGEFKTISLHGLAWRAAGETAERPAFLPMGIAGVYSWRGTVGKTISADGVRVDVKGVIRDFELITWRERTVIIAFDRDAETNLSVYHAREALSRELQSRGANVAYFRWPKDAPKEAKGVDDYIGLSGGAQVLKALQSARLRPNRSQATSLDTAPRHSAAWEDSLIRSATGKPLSVLANAITAIRGSDDWAGVLAYDEFSRRALTLKPPPWVTGAVGPWNDTHDMLLAEWLQRRGILVQTRVASEAAQIIAQENSFHPVRDYLGSLEWDGEQRLDGWLVTYAGAVASTAEQRRYLATVGAKWLISSVARIFEPGCKADCSPIFEAQQGAGKSTMIRVLGGDWYTDEIAELGSKDASMQLAGAWFIELAELDSMNRSEVSRVKAFMSRSTDRFRPSYGRRVIEAPRQSVFGGTVNADAYLRDETGARRFWPVRCGFIDIPRLKADRGQLFAEAVARYRQGESWWLTDAAIIAAAAVEQRERLQEDAWTEPIAEYCESHPGGVTIEQILQFALDLRQGVWTQAHKIRVAGCLTANNWKRRQVRVDASKREWRYFRTGDTPVTSL